MRKSCQFCCSLMLMILCEAEIFNERILVADDLLTHDVAVDIRSEVTGKIKWTYTTGDYFIVKVNITAIDDRHLNATKIHFITSNSTISLHIDDALPVGAYEPATGTGSFHKLPVCLICFLALVLGWRYLKTTILLLLTGLIVQSGTSAFNKALVKTVDIHISAPIQLHYTEVNLYINGGNVEYTKYKHITSHNVSCQTHHHDTGCPFCCHGNGVCSGGRCDCYSNFTSVTNCETEDVTRTFFSHPVDPRLERVKMHNGDTITLSYVFNYLQQQQYLKNSDRLGLNLMSREKNKFSNIFVTLHSDGFIDQMIDLNEAVQFEKVKFRRFKTKQCTLRIKTKNTKLDVNICNVRVHNKLFHKETSDIDSSRTVNNYVTDAHERKPLKDKYLDFFGFRNVTDVLVKTERCGYESMVQKHVFCKLSPVLDKRRIKLHKHIHKDHFRDNNGESVTIVTYEKHNGDVALHLPETTQFPEKAKISQKCEFITSKREQICSLSHRRIYKSICDKTSRSQYGKLTSEMTSFSVSAMCKVFFNFITNYCDIYKLADNSPCTNKYVDQENFFSTRLFKIRPMVLYPDEKIVIGSDHDIVIGSSHHEQLIIVDKTPEFKIVKISVIPSDPVPHDIYQVRMDYECATKHTVVNMTVSGSDMYSNHMTCRGMTSCSCCVVHAAGAPNAVIDQVIIRVTDPSYGFILEKETVIVF